MIYIKFQDLSEEKQEELLQVSREHVTHLYGDSIKKYVEETGADYEKLIDEEYGEIQLDKFASVELKFIGEFWYILSSDGLKNS